MAAVRKYVLFVDDEQSFLTVLQDVLSHWAGQEWEILTAVDAAGALAILQRQPVHLVVLDVRMPVVDGLQFLGLLRRAYPHVPRVVLTGQGTETDRAACLSAGAQLYLEKPVTEAGWRNLYTVLNELLRSAPSEGFRGVLRAMGLEDIVQMECLARNSSVLEITAATCTGRIFIQAGQIVHAEAGVHRGMEALEALLRLKGGQFSLHPYTQPPERTLEDRWEFVLMEAARRRDEAEQAANLGSPNQSLEPEAPRQPPAPGPASEPSQPLAPSPTQPTLPQPVQAALGRPTAEHGQPRIDEVLLAGPQGEVLFQWQCGPLNERLRFLALLSQRVAQVARCLPVGQLDRWEAEAGPVRIVCHMRAERTVWVRRSLHVTEQLPEPQPRDAPGPIEASQAAAAHWLATVPPRPGLLALGVHWANRPGQWRSWSESFPPDSLISAWQSVSDTLQALKSDRLPGQRVCWVYDRATLLSQRRNDGAWLVMLIDRATSTAHWEALHQLTAQFCALD